MIASMLRRSLLALAAGSLAWACGSGAREHPSVVLVLVDQLRKDSADRWMEGTRALAEQGVRFEEMRSVAPWTYPSVISLLSGLYPQQHGADGDATGTRLTVFSDSVPLLPRTLAAAGYATAGFVTNPFLHEWNPLHTAFQHYDASFIRNQGPTRGHGAFVWTERMYSDSVNPAVRAWYDGRPRSGPEFTYVHYIDVHGRAEGPERWAGAPFEGSYESAVRYVDARIQELYAYFRARYGDDLLFVVTSDHGQDEGDDLDVGEGRPWRQRKASLHDFNLRIPLWILPGASVPRALVSEPCANVDVVPTLLEWLGLPRDARAPGRSLLEAVHGHATQPGRSLYARNSAFGRLEEALLSSEHKLIRYRDPRDGSVAARRYFDLAADPREIHPLPAIPAASENELDRVAAPGALAFPARFVETDPALARELDRLGYGGRGTEGEPADPGKREER